MNIEEVKIEDISPYEKNAKHHSREQIITIANSIEQFGFQQPIVVDKDGVVVIGHGRLEAAKYLGLKTVPCIRLKDLPEEKIKALRLADNKTNESEWFEDLLKLELLELEDLDVDMSEFGFDLDDVTDVKSEREREKVVEEMQIKQFEHHDYIVFVFDNQMDWLNAVTEFGLKEVNAGYGKIKKIGLGRVLDGKRLVEKIRHQDSDSE